MDAPTRPEIQRHGALERVGSLQGEDDAREGGDEQGDRQGVHADAAHLDEGETGPRADVRHGAGEVPQEVAKPAHRFDRGDGAPPDGTNHGRKDSGQPTM